jgi:hypothetical protein
VFVSSDDDVPGDQAGYLIVAHGNFTEDNAPVPRGGLALTGTVLTVVVDATTGEITDWGLSDDVADLAKLGPVTADH